MAGHEIVTTVERVLSVEILAGMGMVVRFFGTDGLEHHVQFPIEEAHGLSDMLTLAVSKLPSPVR